MTPIELRDILIAYCERHPEQAAEQRVVVLTTNAGLSAKYGSPVTGANSGADWTQGEFHIRTEDHLVVDRTADRPVEEIAKERLETLEKNCAQLGFSYIPKARRRAWLDGFIFGAGMRFTGERT